MNRVDIIQSLIDKKRAKTYLETGFGYGDCFFNISAPLKIVVEPSFVIFKKRVIKCYFKNLSKNIFNRYYKMDSDEFFSNKAASIFKNGIDIAFLDGLHTYEQSLKDVLNILGYLGKGGIIVLHDCNPISESRAYPAVSYERAKNSNLPGWDGYWSGDVWKTIVYLRSMRKDLNIFVLDIDMGLGIISKGTQAEGLRYTAEEIRQLSYNALANNRKEILNLKPVSYLETFLGG